MSKSKKGAGAKKLQGLLKEFTKPSEYRHLVRILGVDVNGDIPVQYALLKIKGVGQSFANAVLKVTGIDPNKLAGFLTDEEVIKIQEVISDPEAHGIPSWMVNRQKDPETGKNLHYTGSNLILRTRRDIELMIKINSWKGLRHKLGLKVRGQRTKTTGRKGLTVGVKKKK